MIVGIGLDVVELERIKKIWQRYGENFAKKILHPLEVEQIPHENPVNFLGGRFAAKEAVVKALGSGFSRGIAFTDICVDKLDNGRPEAHLSGKAAEQMEQLGARRIFISISHSRHTAAAVAVLES